jgi:hypothetical protein
MHLAAVDTINTLDERSHRCLVIAFRIMAMLLTTDRLCWSVANRTPLQVGHQSLLRLLIERVPIPPATPKHPMTRTNVATTDILDEHLSMRATRLIFRILTVLFRAILLGR